jgi:hypothetical protein
VHEHGRRGQDPDLRSDVGPGQAELELLEPADELDLAGPDEVVHVGPRDRHQVLDQPPHAVELVLDDGDGLADGVGVVPVEGLEHLEVAARDRDGGPQLVADAGHERVLRGGGRVEPVEHGVELGGEQADLVVGVGDLDPSPTDRSSVARAAAARAPSGVSDRHSDALSRMPPSRSESPAAAATSHAASRGLGAPWARAARRSAAWRPARRRARSGPSRSGRHRPTSRWSRAR